MKKRLSLLLAVVMAVTMVLGMSMTAWALEGAGTQTNPYKVTSIANGDTITGYFVNDTGSTIYCTYSAGNGLYIYTTSYITTSPLEPGALFTNIQTPTPMLENTVYVAPDYYSYSAFNDGYTFQVEDGRNQIYNDTGRAISYMTTSKGTGTSSDPYIIYVKHSTGQVSGYAPAYLAAGGKSSDSPLVNGKYYKIVEFPVPSSEPQPEQPKASEEEPELQFEEENYVPNIVKNDKTQFGKENEGSVPAGSYNFSAYVSPSDFAKGVEKIADKKDAKGNITVYSGKPLTINKELLNTLTAKNMSMTYFFNYQGHLYSVTIPAGVNPALVLDKNGHGGPLYVGWLLGTSRLIK